MYKCCTYHPKSSLSVRDFLGLETRFLNCFCSSIANAKGLFFSSTLKACSTYNASKMRRSFMRLFKEILSPRSIKLTVERLNAALFANSAWVICNCMRRWVMKFPISDNIALSLSSDMYDFSLITIIYYTNVVYFIHISKQYYFNLSTTVHFSYIVGSFFFAEN